jgi:hypothetical protein
LLDNIDITLVIPDAIALHIDVEETGLLAENAEESQDSARVWPADSADDSGLKSKRWPGSGLFSARFAPNLERQMLTGRLPVATAAGFVTTLAGTIPLHCRTGNNIWRIVLTGHLPR